MKDPDNPRSVDTCDMCGKPYLSKADETCHCEYHSSAESAMTRYEQEIPQKRKGSGRRKDLRGANPTDGDLLSLGFQMLSDEYES